MPSTKLWLTFLILLIFVCALGTIPAIEGFRSGCDIVPVGRYPVARIFPPVPTPDPVQDPMSLTPLPCSLLKSPAFSKYLLQTSALPTQDDVAGQSFSFATSGPANAYSRDDLLDVALIDAFLQKGAI